MPILVTQPTEYIGSTTHLFGELATGAAEIVEPMATDGEKNDGFAVNQLLSSARFNSILNKLDAWIKWSERQTKDYYYVQTDRDDPGDPNGWTIHLTVSNETGFSYNVGTVGYECAAKESQVIRATATGHIKFKPAQEAEFFLPVGINAGDVTIATAYINTGINDPDIVAGETPRWLPFTVTGALLLTQDLAETVSISGMVFDTAQLVDGSFDIVGPLHISFEVYNP